MECALCLRSILYSHVDGLHALQEIPHRNNVQRSILDAGHAAYLHSIRCTDDGRDALHYAHDYGKVGVLLVHGSGSGCENRVRLVDGTVQDVEEVVDVQLHAHDHVCGILPVLAMKA